MHTHHFHELRQRLVDCRATYRQTKDLFELIKAEATQHAAVVGKNADERATALTIALNQNPSYKASLSALRLAETEVERVEALLEAARDERRAAEWQIRAQLAAALMGTDIPSDGTDPYGDDAFDNVLDSAIDDGMSHGNPNSAYYAGNPRPRPSYSMLESDPYDHAMHVG